MEIKYILEYDYNYAEYKVTDGNKLFIKKMI